MKPFWWLILATCVGGCWLPTVPPAAAGPTPPALGAEVGPRLGRADLPGQPGHAPEFAWEATEPDPEAAGDGEAQLIGGGGAWAMVGHPGSSRVARSATPPAGLKWRGRRPPSIPIRC